MIIYTGLWFRLFNALASNHGNDMLMIVFMYPHPVYRPLMNKKWHEETYEELNLTSVLLSTHGKSLVNIHKKAMKILCGSA